MPSSLPPRFIDVNTAKATQGHVHVIGVVVDLLPKSRSGGSSFVTTFTIKDVDIDGNPMAGLKIKYFNDDESLIPELKLHDVVLLRNIRIRLFRGSLLGVASQHDKIPWTIFRRKVAGQTNSLVIRGRNASEPSPEEKAYALALLNNIPQEARAWSEQAFQDTSTITIPASQSRPAPFQGRDKFSLIKDVKAHTFADFVAEVVKTFREQDKFLLYVTDYTSNGELFDYYDPSADDADGGDFISRRQREWKGPYGQMTLQVTLWQPHASFAQGNVKEGDTVSLRNVHIKYDRATNRLEGSMHTDRLYPHKICVSILDLDDDERVTELVRRKRDYWRNARHSRLYPGSKKKKNDEAKSSATNQKQERPKKKVRREENQSEISEPSAPAPAPAPVRVKRDEVNPNIQAAHPAVPCRPLEDILDAEIHLNNAPGGYEYRLPFQNINYRAVVRVVDFYPPRLEDFAVPYNPEDDMLSESGTSSEDSDEDALMSSEYPHRRRIWEWRFCLLVENGKPVPRGQPKKRMRLYVSGKDAEYLLKIDAADLRKNGTRLDELREKLFHLWADLEEKKKALPGGKLDSESLENPSGKPFTCCIKEYGIKTREEHDPDAMSDDEHSTGGMDPLAWERRFHMFGTTINA